MAEVAVMSVLDKLSKLISEKHSVLGGILEDAIVIKDHLDGLMARALRVADEKEEIDPRVQAWLKLVLEVVYNTEDALDEFFFRFGAHRTSGEFYIKIQNRYTPVKNLRAWQRLALELRRIKARFDFISQEVLRLMISSDSTDHNYNKRRYDYQWGAVSLQGWDLVGIEDPKHFLVNLLLAVDDDLRVHSVVGMGGLGKTTLVNTVYFDLKVNAHFQYRVWVVVSQTFRIEELLKSAIRQLVKQTKQDPIQDFEAMNSSQLKEFIKNILYGHRYIIVLDDIWSLDVWTDIKDSFPTQSFGSRIVITTRNSRIGALTSDDTNGVVYSLKSLSREDSWTLFCKKTFRRGSCPQHLVRISEDILMSCVGLPLAIVEIAGVLSTMEQSIQTWKRFQDSLFEKIVYTKNTLSLSYYDLPYYLKSCFLYLSVFREDEIIEKAKVIRLWIGEGFVRENNLQPIKEEVAEGYLNELLHRNLIIQMEQKTSVGRIKSIRLHTILREIILSKSELVLNSAIIATGQHRKLSSRIRHLALDRFDENILRESLSKRHLRSLLIFTHEVVSSLPELLTSDYIPLGVLDLEGVKLKEIPKGVFNLINLKYLSLRSTGLRNIPKSIGSLQNLEILDLKYTNVMELPVETIKLHKLWHLIVGYHWTGGFSAPFNIGKLLSLQKLCYIRANETDGIKVVSEIGKLTRLRKFGVGMLRQEDGKELCSSLEKLINLCSLSLKARINEILGIQHSLSTVPLCLHTLKLDGRLERIPQWFSSLVRLTKLCLCRSSLPEDPLGLLQDLPMLAHLDLYESYNGEGLCFKAEKFPKLKFLRIRSFTVLKSVEVEEAAMPLLEKLHIADCKLFEQVPLGIHHLSKLKSVVFIGLADELMLSLDQNGENYTKISHIPHKFVNNGVIA
ncbi:disease resistance protein RPM1-like [Ipomoea triloba]|uniref:disease resistance protein RPM1-like n=1 Tax=Ipomoea triloba TaxID=35885 RepID=UPI00125D3DFE|nr:disease resistance protein RPM1-like [Ipomoea triloba]